MHDELDKLIKDMGAVKTWMLLNSIVLCILLMWLLVKPTKAEASTTTATGGSVTSTISVGDSDETVAREEVISRAKARGYFTPSEFAIFEGIHQRTVYRQLESGSIEGAQKVDGHWKIFCD